MKANFHQRPLVIITLLPVLFFGLPFLSFTDFFPFHRYGMFARMPAKKPEAEVRILLAYKDTLLTLETGSPCLDRGLLKKAASEAFENDEKAALLSRQLRKSMKTIPDSIILESSFSGNSKRKPLCP